MLERRASRYSSHVFFDFGFPAVEPKETRADDLGFAVESGTTAVLSGRNPMLVLDIPFLGLDSLVEVEAGVLFLADS